MASFGRYNSQSYAPSAPAFPAENPVSTSVPPTTSTAYPSGYGYGQGPATNTGSYHQGTSGGGYGHGYTTTTSASSYPYQHQHQGGGYGQSGGYGQGSSYEYQSFPPETHPDVIRNFHMVDRDRSGFIDERELQQALSSGFQRFDLRTIRLLMFLFKSNNDPSRIGPKEFAALWECLGNWRAIFDRYDRDRSGKIDPLELRDALYGIGYALPGSVLQLLISKYDNGSGRMVELGFDSFVECGMIIKGLTDKFKEKDTRYTGSATLPYDTFMTMVIPFLVSYD